MARYEIAANHSNTKVRKILTCFSMLLLLGPVNSLTAQDNLAPPSSVREYIEPKQRANYDVLLIEFGNNKQPPIGFELQPLFALRHYPELRDTKINFIAGDVSIPILYNTPTRHLRSATTTTAR